MYGKRPAMGLCRNSHCGGKFMSKPLKDYNAKMWLDPGNKSDLSCMCLSASHGYGKGSVDANIMISDGGDTVYIDCSVYKKRSNKKKLDMMIDMLVILRARINAFEEAGVDLSAEDIWPQ